MMMLNAQNLHCRSSEEKMPLNNFRLVICHVLFLYTTPAMKTIVKTEVKEFYFSDARHTAKQITATMNSECSYNNYTHLESAPSPTTRA
jgi:hypothetical protein